MTGKNASKSIFSAYVEILEDMGIPSGAFEHYCVVRGCAYITSKA